MLKEIEDEFGRYELGLMVNTGWHQDPKRLAFTLSRYKFVAKMLAGRKSVLEIGCGDGFASRIVAAEVEHLTLSDVDPIFIDEVRKHPIPESAKIDTVVADFVAAPLPGPFDGIYGLDVLEHIQPADENAFMSNLCASLADDGAVIVGLPSLESQAYASPGSKAGHVNCKSGDQLKEFLSRYFANVFVFSMNDEVVHTGYFPMAQYLLALSTQKKAGGGGGG